MPSAGFALEDLLSTGVIVGAQGQPGREMFGGGERTQVGTHLGQDRKSGIDLDAGNLGQIDSETFEKESMPVAFESILGVVAFGGSLVKGRPRLGLECSGQSFHLPVTFSNLSHELLPPLVGLAHNEKVLFTVVSLQGMDDRLATRLDPRITLLGESSGIALPPPESPR